MMDKNEAVQKLSSVGRLSIAHAEDLYDSIISKPVVPQYVADWYEKHKNDLNEDIWAYLTSWADTKWDEFKYWMYHTGKNEAITTIVNMHQFGYTVEKEPRYTVRIKGVDGYAAHLNENLDNHEWFFASDDDIKGYRIKHTRKELEEAGFGWVFDCPGVEVKEVKQVNRLKQLRKQKKLTQEELAELIGVTKRTVSHWEKYGFSSADKLQKLAECFEVSISYLLDYDTNNTFSELITKVNEWAISRGLDKGNPKVEWMKVTEEVGEIRDVFLKPHDFADPEWSLKDAIGDSIVTLVVLCLQLGYDVEECLTIAYNDIKDRQGVIIDDNFVKERVLK